jgi:membrane fusion protein, multidrug efflux system
MKAAWRIFVCAAGALLLAACSGRTGSMPTVPTPQPPLASVLVAPVSAPAERRLDGVVEAINHATVAAQTSGRVAAVNFDVGDYVPAGAVIIRLRATEQHAGLAAAQAALREAQARASEAETRYRRILDMYDRQVVPKATLDQAAADRDAAAARLAAARATVLSASQGVGYTEIRAPYAGVVTERRVQVGETVVPGTPLMSGVSLQHLRVVADIPQSIVATVRRTLKGAVYLDGRRIEATQVTVFPVASTPSNTFRAWLDLPGNTPGISPGMLVKVGFVIGVRTRLLVPASAIVHRSEVTAVYLVRPDGSTSLQQVRLGDRFADQVEVLSGLVAGDRVAEDPLAAMQRLEGSSAGVSAGR